MRSPAVHDLPLDPPSHLRRPAARHRHRAPRVPDAVVAGHVRPRAEQAVRDLPGRGGRPRHRRLPHLLPLRHDLAHHERGGRARAPARGDRHGAAGRAAAPRAGARSALHAGGAHEQHRRDGPLRAPRVPGSRDAPALLPGQRGGRHHHVAHPGDAAGNARRHPQRRRPAQARGVSAVTDRILAIETSCDDTCAAVVTGDGVIEANVISSQGVHDRYGGVVPEVASRHHLELATPVVDDALARAGATLDDIDLVAVTAGPGLVGALLVGVATAKALAAARGLPLAAVDHLQGHVAANFLPPEAGGAAVAEPLEPPFVCLIASGGHTFLARVDDHAGFTVLGQTLDDAAGEAIDKGARLLGLPFPGGPHLERLAAEGDPGAFAFPTSRGLTGLDFSFAGLKTALLYKVRDLGEEEAQARRADLAAAYQRAIVEQLAQRVERALEQTGLDRLAIGGGAAATAPLRARREPLAATVKIPPRALCTDNAAMIASAARYVEPVAFPGYLDLEVHATGARAL